MKISEMELEKKLNEIYGKDWTLKDLDENEPYAAEFLKRLETGV